MKNSNSTFKLAQTQVICLKDVCTSSKAYTNCASTTHLLKVLIFRISKQQPIWRCLLCCTFLLRLLTLCWLNVFPVALADEQVVVKLELGILSGC